MASSPTQKESKSIFRGPFLGKLGPGADRPQAATVTPTLPASLGNPPQTSSDTKLSSTGSSSTAESISVSIPTDISLLPSPETSPYSKTTTNLGSGTFGPVDLAVHKATQKTVALKRLATGAAVGDALERRMLMNELLFGQTLEHPAIVQTFEAVQDRTDLDTTENAQSDPKVSKSGSFGTKGRGEIRLAMEVCSGGGLLTHLLGKGTHGHGLGEVEARRIFRQLVGAVAHIHKRGVAHRDLKLDNLLLDENMNVKLIDFGMATFFDPTKTVTEFMGSIWYEAPEIHRSMPYRPDKIDIWALGIIFYTLLVSQFPFSISDPKRAVNIIISVDLKLPSYCSPAAQRLFRRMCERDPKKRADIYEILWDEWVNTGYSDLPFVGSAQDEKLLRLAGQGGGDPDTQDTVELMMRFCGHAPEVLDADLSNKYIERKLRELLQMTFQRNPGAVIRLPLFENNVPSLVSFRRKQTAAKGSLVPLFAIPTPIPPIVAAPKPHQSVAQASATSVKAETLAERTTEPAGTEPKEAATPLMLSLLGISDDVAFTLDLDGITLAADEDNSWSLDSSKAYGAAVGVVKSSEKFDFDFDLGPSSNLSLDDQYVAAPSMPMVEHPPPRTRSKVDAVKTAANLASPTSAKKSLVNVMGNFSKRLGSK